ncbi:hypothetical protein AMECASPLE_011902 [Ameca splendens]|uniref:Uncharacterized protein n=1 Tax=Ameca splendens TaxID=208324 RepID=A0ABV0YPB1_9TELE
MSREMGLPLDAESHLDISLYLAPMMTWIVLSVREMLHHWQQWAQPTYSDLFLNPLIHFPYKCGTMCYTAKSPNNLQWEVFDRLPILLVFPLAKHVEDLIFIIATLQL